LLISKEEFCQIIKRLKDTDDIVDKVNNMFNSSIDNKINDFMNAASLMICHEDIVVQLLEKMFNDTHNISWWLYECNYGEDFKIGDLTDSDKEIDLTTPEKLYDYLIENMERTN